MTKDDTIKLAREAGWDMDGIFNDVFGFGVRLERFANLVAKHEREACAKVCESRITLGTGSVAILNGAADAIKARGEKA